MASWGSIDVNSHTVGTVRNSRVLLELQWFKTQSKRKGARLLVPASQAKPASASKTHKSSESFLEGCEFVVIGKLSVTQVSFVHA